MLEDRDGNPIQIVQHIIIPESQDAKSLTLQPRGSLCICNLIWTLAVLAPINFNDDFVLEANKIDYIFPNWLLAAKFETRQLSQLSP